MNKLTIEAVVLALVLGIGCEKKPANPGVPATTQTTQSQSRASQTDASENKPFATNVGFSEYKLAGKTDIIPENPLITSIGNNEARLEVYENSRGKQVLVGVTKFSTDSELEKYVLEENLIEKPVILMKNGKMLVVVSSPGEKMFQADEAGFANFLEEFRKAGKFNYLNLKPDDVKKIRFGWGKYVLAGNEIPSSFKLAYEFERSDLTDPSFMKDMPIYGKAYVSEYRTGMDRDSQIIKAMVYSPKNFSEIKERIDKNLKGAFEDSVTKNKVMAVYKKDEFYIDIRFLGKKGLTELSIPEACDFVNCLNEFRSRLKPDQTIYEMTSNPNYQRKENERDKERGGTFWRPTIDRTR